jgi:hypothetical protein
VPRIPQALAVRPNPSTGGFLESEECSVPASGTLQARGREPRGAAERPTVSGRAAGPARGKTKEGARGKKRLTDGTGLAEEEGRRRRSGGGAEGNRLGSRARPTGEGKKEKEVEERGRKRWAAREGPAQGLLLLSFPLIFLFFPILKHSNKTI